MGKNQCIKKVVHLSKQFIEFTRIVCVFLSAAFMVLMTIQVIMRYVFNFPIYGIEEWVVCLMIWYSALATFVVFWEEGHARIEWILQYCPSWFKTSMNVAEYLLVISCGFLLSKAGKMLFEMQKKTAILGGVPFSRAYYYALPIAILGVLFVIFGIVRLTEFLFDRDEFKKIERGGNLDG